jgi:hypothetical protein
MAGPEPPQPPDDPTRPTEPLRPVPPRQPVPPRAAPGEPVGYPPGGGGYPPGGGYPQEPPPKDPWWSNPWAAFSVGLLGALLGALVGFLIGNGNAETKTVASGPAVTHTVTSTSTKVTTVTNKTVTQAPPNPADEQKRVEAEEKVKTLERENEELKKAEAG